MTAVGSPERETWSSFIAAHRAHAVRRRNLDDRDRVLIFTRDASTLRRIEHELFGERVSSTVVESLSDVVVRLTLSPPPWPRCLIVDTVELSSVDLQLLAAIREAGWRGVVIAIGDAPRDACQALGIDVSVPRNFEYEVLRTEIKRARNAA